MKSERCAAVSGMQAAPAGHAAAAMRVAGRRCGVPTDTATKSRASDATIRACAASRLRHNSGTSRMAVAMAVRAAAAMGMHAVGRQIDHLPVTHAALGDDVVGKFLYLGAAAL
jgi:hypothetical protein